MTGPQQSLSIVMAALDEALALPGCVARTLDFLRSHVVQGELIIVNDGSSDETGQIIDDLAASEPEVRAFHLATNTGMGAALLKGYKHARNDWVTMLPGDGQLDAYDLLDFFDVAHDADLITSLYRNRRYPLHRKILSLSLRVLTATIVGTRARTEGTYLVRRTVLKTLKPRSHSFLLNLEIPIRAKRAGFRIKTVYMNLHDRHAGHSKAATPARIAQTFLDHFSLRADLERERFPKVLARLNALVGR